MDESIFYDELIFFIALLLITYSYLIYPIIIVFLANISGLWRKDINPVLTVYPSVTVIVAAYNEQDVIEDKILNCLALDYPPEKIEIIIASDGSSDSTDEICKKYKKIKLVRIAQRTGKANALNNVIYLAKGEIILLSDANTILAQDALKQIVPYFHNNSVGGVCGNLILKCKKMELASYETLYWYYESAIKNMESRIYSVLSVNGGIYAIRKSLYVPIPENVIVDDLWISINILQQGKRIVFEKKAAAYEYISNNLMDEFSRKVRIGCGNLQVFLQKPVISAKMLFFYYSHKVIRWIIPLLFIMLYTALSSSVLFHNNNPLRPLFYIINFFLIAGLMGILIDTKLKLINLTSYFILFNSALFIGYATYISGKHTVKWKMATRVK